jgi:transposase-like protein
MMPRKYNKSTAEKAVRDIRRTTRRHYSAEEKIRIVLESLRGEDQAGYVGGL